MMVEMMSPPLWQILLANLYDALALTGVLFLATLPWAAVSDGDYVAAGSLAFQLYLAAVVFAYFTLSWWRGGQTLGMRPWRLYVVNEHERQPGFAQAALRFATAIASWAAAGIGVLWYLFGHRSWHDLASKTHLVKGAKP
ncbi:MAG: RDD family protein [Pseudomonadota bacterium]